MDEFLAFPPASVLLSSPSFVHFHGCVPGLGSGFVLGQGVSSGCVGGSFSSVTLALLETPVENIPDLFQPREILLVPSGSCRAPGHPLPSQEELDCCSQGWCLLGGGSLLPSLCLGPQSDLGLD